MFDLSVYFFFNEMIFKIKKSKTFPEKPKKVIVSIKYAMFFILMIQGICFFERKIYKLNEIQIYKLKLINLSSPSFRIKT